MNWGAILYWVVFGFVAVVWLVWGYVVLFGNGDGLGYSRNSVESTPSRKDGSH